MASDEEIFQRLKPFMKNTSSSCIPSESMKITAQLDAQLGDGARSYPIIHVTGTNGKGSVVLKISKALQFSGCKVGMFTSPHLYDVGERIQVSGEMISPEVFLRYLDQVVVLSQQGGLKPNFFEILTVIALRYFADREVDVAVIEVGIGGLYDATNFVTPILSVITSISYDHTDLLGKTLDAIAEQKAGIIKPKVPVVLGHSAQREVILRSAYKKEAPVVCAPKVEGSFDDENTKVAEEALEFLRRERPRCFPLTEDAIKEGLKSIPPCRFEIMRLPDTPHLPEAIIFDVAHNPDGFAKLLHALQIKFPQRQARFALGMSKGKEVARSMEVLISGAHHIYLPNILSEKLLSPSILQQELETLGYARCSVGDSLEELLSTALQESELLVVCGSFYIMKEIKRCLNACVSQKLALPSCIEASRS